MVFLSLFNDLQVTSAVSDVDLGFTIVSCFISPTSKPSGASDYSLIETVCPTDDSVVFYPQKDGRVPHTQTDAKTFSFTFNSKLNASLLFLHCEISQCSRGAGSSQRLPPVRRVSPRWYSPSPERRVFEGIPAGG